MLERLFTAWGQPSPLVTTSVVLAIAVGIGGAVHPSVRARSCCVGSSGCRCSRRPPTFGIVLMLVNTLGPEGVAPFIYFRF